MRKQGTVKEDGRILVYYWFSKQPADLTTDENLIRDRSESVSRDDCVRETETHN